MKLTTRERVLIGILIVVALCAGLFLFLFQPQLNQWSANRLNYTTLRQQQEDAEQVIALAAQNRQEISNMQQEAAALYQMMEQTQSYDVSLLLSNMLNRHQLNAYSLEFSPYQDALALEAQNTEGVEEETGAENEEEQKTQEEPVALVRQAELRFTGARENMASFLDEIAHYNTSVVVDGFAIQADSQQTVYTVTISFYEFVSPVLTLESGVSSATTPEALPAGETGKENLY